MYSTTIPSNLQDEKGKHVINVRYAAVRVRCVVVTLP